MTTFWDACVKGDMEEIFKFETSKEDWDIQEGMEGACFGGHLETIEFFKNKGATYSTPYCFEWACFGGHPEVVYLLINTHNFCQEWWLNGIYHACCGGHLKMVNYLITSARIQTFTKANWNYFFQGACRSRNIECILSLIERGADDWNLGLLQAYLCRNFNVAKLMFEKGATRLEYSEFDHNEIVPMLEFGIPEKKLLSSLNFQKVDEIFDTIGKFRKEINCMNILLPDILQIVASYSLL